MIRYKFDEEVDVIKHYASILNNDIVLSIISVGEVKSAQEAEALSEFFWVMVDKSIEDEENNVESPWTEGAEYWNEKILNSLSGYLERAGYEEIWERVSDKQD